MNPLGLSSDSYTGGKSAIICSAFLHSDPSCTILNLVPCWVLAQFWRRCAHGCQHCHMNNSPNGKSVRGKVLLGWRETAEKWLQCPHHGVWIITLKAGWLQGLQQSKPRICLQGYANMHHSYYAYFVARLPSSDFQSAPQSLIWKLICFKCEMQTSSCSAPLNLISWGTTCNSINILLRGLHHWRQGRTEVLGRSRGAVCQESRRSPSKYGFFLMRRQQGGPAAIGRKHTRGHEVALTPAWPTGECQRFSGGFLFPFFSGFDVAVIPMCSCSCSRKREREREKHSRRLCAPASCSWQTAGHFDQEARSTFVLWAIGAHWAE